MIFITGPLYSGKRTFARNFRGSVIADVQAAAAETLAKVAQAIAMANAQVPWQTSLPMNTISSSPPR